MLVLKRAHVDSRGSQSAAAEMRGDDPWGAGNALEWATTSPPPEFNFKSLPPIRSKRPAFDLHHPEFAKDSPR